MTETFERRILVFSLGQRAVLLKKSANESSASDGISYVRTGNLDEENVFGFYDWLRDSEGVIISIRLEFFDWVPAWLNDLGVLDMFVDERKLFVTLFFGTSRAIDESISGDALLGDVWQFHGPGNSVAIAINL